MTLIKDDLINSIYKQHNIPKTKSAELVEFILELIKKSMESGEDVLISGLGKFCIKDKEERKGRDPQTGKDLRLRSRRVVKFKCSSVLKDRMNGKQ